MDLRFQRRLAAKVLGCGEERVWMDPNALSDIADAATKEDIRKLVEDEVIKKKPVVGISRARINQKNLQKRKGRRRGHGSRKGKKGAGMPSKELWIARIRVLRRRLKLLRDTEVIDRRTYRMLYRRAKGGEFRNVAHLDAYIQSIIRER